CHTLFPYTTLFRSAVEPVAAFVDQGVIAAGGHAHPGLGAVEDEAHDALARGRAEPHLDRDLPALIAAPARRHERRWVGPVRETLLGQDQVAAVAACRDQPETGLQDPPVHHGGGRRGGGVAERGPLVLG